MNKSKGHSLVFTSNDIERIARSSTAEVAAKQIVTVREGRRVSTVSTSGAKTRAAAYKEASGRKVASKSSKQTKELAASVLSQASTGYSSKQAVDMFNQAFKKVRA